MALKLCLSLYLFLFRSWQPISQMLGLFYKKKFADSMKFCIHIVYLHGYHDDHAQCTFVTLQPEPR
jgi:hypothetical protein